MDYGKNRRRLIGYSSAVGVLYSGFFTVGRVLQEHTYLSYLQKGDVFSFCIGAVVCTAAVMALYLCLERWADRQKHLDSCSIGSEKSPGRWYSRPSLGLSFGVILVCYIPAFLAAFPGVFSYDAPHQVWQFVTGNVSDNQPVVSSLIIYTVISVGRKLLGSWEGGVGLYVVLQILFACATFAYLLQLLYEKTKNKLMYGIGLAFFSLHPMHHLFVVNCAKDVAYAYFTLWVVLFFGQAISGRGKLLLKKKNCVFLSVFLLLFLFYRNNSIYALLLFVPVALWYYKCARKPLFTVFAVTIGIYYLVTGPVYQHLGLKPANRMNEMMAVFEQQIANTYIKHGNTFTEEEMDVIFSVFPQGTIEDYRQMYVPENSDMIRPHLNAAAIKEMGLGTFFKTWAGLGLKHPVSYIEAVLNNTRGYWYMFHEISGIASDRYIEYTNSVYPSGIHTERYPLLKFTAKCYRKIGEEYYLGRIKVLSWLFSIASTLMLYLFLLGFTGYKKMYHLLVAFYLPVVLYLTIFAGPLALLRYAYPMTLCIPYFFGLILEHN